MTKNNTGFKEGHPEWYDPETGDNFIVRPQADDKIFKFMKAAIPSISDLEDVDEKKSNKSLINIQEEVSMPSQFEIGDRVIFSPMARHAEKLNIEITKGIGEIVAIRFTKAKVFYDIVDDYHGYLFDDVDSVNVTKKFETSKMEESLINIPIWESYNINETTKIEIPRGMEAFSKDSYGEIFLATGDGRTVKAQSTDKVFDDGQPATKYFTRGGMKSVKTPNGEFYVIESKKYGWWYYNVGRTWYAVKMKDYSTPPFDY